MFRVFRVASLHLVMLLGLPLVACETQRLNVGYDLPDEFPGQCVRLPPLGFDGPALLWFGPAGEAPNARIGPPRVSSRG